MSYKIWEQMPADGIKINVVFSFAPGVKILCTYDSSVQKFIFYETLLSISVEYVLTWELFT